MDNRYPPALMPLLRQARAIVVTTHASPDGDGLAGMLALAGSLRLVNRETHIVSPSPIPRSYRFLRGWESVLVCSPTADTTEPGPASEVLRAADIIICLDCSDLGRLEHLYADHPARFRSATVINFDHHPSNSHFGHINLVDPSAAAVCELLAQVMEREGMPLSEEIATALMVGIVSDTLGFRTASTSAATLRTVAVLMEKGAPLFGISDRIFNDRSPRSLTLWGLVLAGARVEDGLVWANLTRRMLEESATTPEDADNLVDFLAGVHETRAAFLFTEQEDRVRVSIRTAGELDAAALATSFGGGGHTRAAGCTVQGTLGQAQALLLAEARLRLGLVASGHEHQQESPS